MVCLSAVNVVYVNVVLSEQLCLSVVNVVVGVCEQVCLSAQLGGNRLYHRMDLLDELTLELTQIDRHLELNNIDKELHDSYATRKEFFEVSNARQFLFNAQSDGMECSELNFYFFI